MRIHPRAIPNIFGKIKNLGLKPNALIDAGPGVANTEAWDFCNRYGDQCDILGFEPCVVRYNALIQHAYPGELTNLALGAENGEADLYKLSSRNNTSLHFGPRECTHYENGKPVVTKTQVVKLDNYYDRFAKKAVFLWADIKGGELDLIKGGQRMLTDCVIAALLEVRAAPSSKTWCEAEDVIAAMEELGFVKRIQSPMSGKDKGTNHYDIVFIKK